MSRGCRNGCECNTPAPQIGVDECFRGATAKRDRDQRARGLRKRGYTVKVKTVGFQDLGYGTAYILRATAGPCDKLSCYGRPTHPQHESNAL